MQWSRAAIFVVSAPSNVLMGLCHVLSTASALDDAEVPAQAGSVPGKPVRALSSSPCIRLLIPAVLVMYQIGPPGPERRRLAMRFAEVLQLEVEYLAITRDTTGRARPQ